MRWATVGVVVVVAAVLALLIRPPIKEPGVAHELIAMQRAIDKNTVRFFGNGARPSIGDISDALRNRQDDADKVDAQNSEKLASIFDAHGWPTKKEVGEEAERAAFNVVGRAREVALKERALELMEKAGIKRTPEIARLIDMVAVIKGQPQTYGTVWQCEDGYAKPITPVADPNRALELRRDVGLPAYEKFGADFCRGVVENGNDRYIIKTGG